MVIIFDRFFIITLSLLLILIWLAYTRVKGAEYAPTNKKTAISMIEIASITRKDIVYELGSGLGGLAIKASKKARNVKGIEFDYMRYLISILRVRLKKIKNIKFICGDIFKEDISDANVVLLFLKQKTNQKIKGKLSKLKKGTRIVSNIWTFEGWKEVKTDKKNNVHLYVIGKSNS